MDKRILSKILLAAVMFISPLMADNTPTENDSKDKESTSNQDNSKDKDSSDDSKSVREEVTDILGQALMERGVY